MTSKRNNKYNAERTTYNGDMYDSKKEARHARLLDMLKKEQINPVIEVQRQFKMPVVINSKLVCTYVCDFKVTYQDGRVEYQDVKGMRTSVYKLKKKIIEAYYGITIKEI